MIAQGSCKRTTPSAEDTASSALVWPLTTNVTVDSGYLVDGFMGIHRLASAPYELDSASCDDDACTECAA